VHFLKRELAPNKIQLDLNFNAAESLANINSYFPSAKKLRAFEKKKYQNINLATIATSRRLQKTLPRLEL
jgi:hypothetical protein